MIKFYDSEIIDVLPNILKEQHEVTALSYALKKSNQKLIDTINKSLVYAAIETLPEKILDVLAVELRAQYYLDTLPVEKKRTIIKNTLYLYAKAGTKEAVEEMIYAVFGSGEIVEWFEIDGVPGTFEINTTESIDINAYKKFSEMISKVKNIRSHLITINFVIKLETDFTVGMAMTTLKKLYIK